MTVQEQTDTDDASAADVLIERRGAVGIVTMNRPDRLNAVTPDQGTSLRSAFLELEADPEVRGIVFTGAGRAFCAGADIKGGTGDAETVLRDVWNPLVETMQRLEVPIIGAINGVAAGAGASLAFACDLRVAAAQARFQLSFTKIGLMPDAGATWLLPRMVGLGRAMELSLLAGDLGADDAARWGLVNSVAEDGHAAVAAAIALAERFASLSSSVAAAKTALHHSLDRGLAAQLDHEAVTQGRLQKGPDFAEATTAFKEKRTPNLAVRTPPAR